VLKIVGTIFVITALCGSAAAASIDSSLDTPIDDFTSDVGNEFHTYCRAHNKPCGREEVRCGDFQILNAPKIHLKKTTHRKVLDQIVQLHRGYKWVQRDGVLNLEPIHRKGQDLLARKIDHLSIHGSTTLKAFLLVFKAAGIRVGMSYSGPPMAFAPIDTEFNNVTVRDALNAIAKADGQVVWFFCADKPEESAGSFSLSSWRTAGTP